MRRITEIFKGLETLSSELEAVPPFVFFLILCLAASALLCYYVVVPRCRLEAKQKKLFRRGCIWSLLVLYIGTILLITVITRDPEQGYRINLRPLNAILDFDHINREIIRDIANVFLFIPVGMLFIWQARGRRLLLKSFLFSVELSLAIEFVQLIGKLGIFDVDDLLFNIIGGTVGSLAALFWRSVNSKKSAARLVFRIVLGLFVFLIFCGTGVFGAYHFLRVSGEKGMKENKSTVALELESRNEGKERKNSDPDLVWHDGKAYRFNEDITTVLCMGIDQRSEVIELKEEISGESGQADSIFLVVLNPRTKKIKVIAISRDTMTEIPIFDYRGNYIGDAVNHLGLAYAFGNGKETSCQYMVDSVSRLFYGIPINGYAAFNMETIAEINDAVGGVTVTVPEDLSKADADMTKGAVVTLDGGKAYTFVRWRDTSISNSNNLRIQRQKQYLVYFFQQALAAVRKDYTLPVTLYQEFEEKMVTNIGLDHAVYLITEASNMSFDESGMIVLKGDSSQGSVYDEVYVDDDALYELILDTFYVQEDTEDLTE